MSPFGQAFSYIASLLSPLVSPSSISEAQTFKRQTINTSKPTESSASYFPRQTSRSSSVTSSTSSQESLPQAASPSRCQTSNYPPDALSREFAAPAEELDIAKQLELEPRKWALHASLKRAAAVERAVKVDDAETKAKELAAAKARLLALARKA
ncbi:hypothetical protein BJ170DRAFT_349467 [Xylariales sp. AK1849]|nr:hypothetical protein BJ170DRAFT_349467 [Xylariales sp. AK1849]